MAAIKLLGNRCVCCGENHIEFLTIDHIHGRAYNGHGHNMKGSKLALRLLKSTDPTEDYRVLCMNCNWSIGQRGYCPHRPFGLFGKIRRSGRPRKVRP